jgi:hypothetical protein
MNQRGQVMLLTVLILSGLLLSASTIGGLLMLYQIRQSADIANSTKAIYAADSGIEKRIYEFLSEGSKVNTCSDVRSYVLANGTTVKASCVAEVKPATETEEGLEKITIKSTGESRKNFRALEVILERVLPKLPPPSPPAA